MPDAAVTTVTTVFRFVCEYCAQANERRERHLVTIRPHLVSTKCDHCHRLNWFGGLTGTIEPPLENEPLPKP